METGDVIIHEPISTKISVEEASEQDHLSMEIADKVKMSSVLDDEITSSTIIPEKEDVTEVVNGSGDKETEESEREKEEAGKTILVKEKASETEKDEQGSIFVHEPENAENATISLSDVTLEKRKDDGSTQTPEEVIFDKSVTEEDQTETKHAAEQEKEMNNIPKVLVDKSTVKFDQDETEKSLVSPHDKILIERRDEEIVTKDETDEEKDSRSVETSVNETEAMHNAVVPVEEISRNIVKEDDREGEKEESVEATNYIDDTQKIKVEEVQESPLVIETSTVQGENIEFNVTRDTDEHEHVLVREMAQTETLVTDAEAVNTPTVQVTVEDHAETKHSVEQEVEIEKISKVLRDTAPVKSDEDAIDKSLNSACEDVLTKTDEVKEEEDSRTVETSVNGSEAEHTATNPVKETATFGESLPEVETTTRALEADKNAETELDVKEKETVKEDLSQENVNSEETTVQESECLKENAEKISHEVDVEREKEEDLTPNTEEHVIESPREIETPTIQGEDIKLKAALDHDEEVVESSRETKEHEHGETRVETVDISNTLETEEDTETSPDLKEDNGEETFISSNGVNTSNVEAEEFGEHTEHCSSDIKEESHRGEEFVEVKSKETVQDEITEDNLVDVPSKETEKYEDKDPETALDANTESREKCEETPLDLTLKVDKEEVKDERIKNDQVDGTQTVENQIGLDMNEPEAKQTDGIRNGETGESPVEKLAALPDVESLTQVSESVDEKIKEKPEEEVTPQQEGSYGIETDSVQKSSELGEKVGEAGSVIDLTPLQEEPRLPNEQALGTKLQEEEIEKHEQTQVEVKSGEVPSAELEGETVIAAEKIENVKADEEEQAADKIQKNLETVETVDSSLPASSEEQEHDPASKTGETGPSLTADEEITVRDSEPCLPNEQETKLEKHEPKHEEVSSVQKSLGEEKFDEKSKVPSASLSEEREGETIVEAERIDDIKTNKADKIQKSLEAVEIAETHSSLPSSSERQEHGTVAEAEMKEDDKVEEAEPTSLILSEKIVEATKADEEMMISGLNSSGTSKALDNVCTKQDEFGTTKATEAFSNQTVTPTSELVSEQNDQTSKLVEEIHEVPKESSSEVPVSMLAAKEDTKSERPVSTGTEETAEEAKPIESVSETRNDTLTEEAKRGDEAIKKIETAGALDSSGTLKTHEEEEFRNPEAPKLEESKEDKSQKILPTETSQADPTLASELVSDQTPKMAEEEEKEAHKLQTETLQEDQNPSFVSELENQIPKQVEENYEEETKEAHKLQFSVETSQVEQTASLVLEQDDQTSKLAHSQTSFSEAPVSKLASGEDELVNLREGGHTQEEQHVSAETEERTGERSVIDLAPPQEKPHLPNEQVMETKLEREETEKHEQRHVEVKSGEVPLVELEGEAVMPAEKIENIKANEEEQAADKIPKNLETAETVDSSLPLSSEEQEHGLVSENVKDKEVKEEEPPVQITREHDATESHERKDEFSKTGETTAVEVEETRDIGPSLTADEKVTVRDMPQDETTVDACTIQEATISKTPETNNIESNAVSGPIGLKEESQEIIEDTEPSLDLKEDKEQEDPRTTKTDISSDEVKFCDVQAEEFGEHFHLPEIKDDGQGREETVEAKPKVIVHDESTQEKDENILDGESSETMQKTCSSQEEISNGSDAKEEPIEQETKLQEEQIEKHKQNHEEVSSDQKSLGEEKFDGISKVSSASLSEEWEGETIVEAEKIDDIKTNEAEQEADKIQKSLETVEIAEPHNSLPSSSEKQEHGTVSEAEMNEDEKVEEAEPTSLMLSEKADEEMMTSGLDDLGTSKKLEDVCIKQDEFDSLSETTKATEASNNQTVTPTSELVSEQNDQTSKLVEEIHEVPKESSSEVPVSMLAAKEIKDTEPERPVSTETEETAEETKQKESVDETRNDTLTAEAKRGDEASKERETTGDLDSLGTLKTSEEEEFQNPEAPKLEESKENKSQDILPTETSQADQALASELGSDQTPKMAEEEEKEKHKLQVAGEQMLPVETLQKDQNSSFVSELENQIPKQVEEIYEEETKEAHNLQFPVETSQDEQTASLVLEQDDQTSKLAHLQAPVSKLASGEDELMNLQEGGDTQEERHVSAGTGERVGETKPEANYQVKTPTKLTKEEDEYTKITNGPSISNSPEDACLKQEELKDTETLQQGAATEDQSPLRNDNQDYPTGEAEQEDESSSVLPVVEILRGLHTTLETEREITDSASSGGNMIREPTEKVQKTSDAEVVSNEKDSAAETTEANRLPQDESGETEEKSLPIEELKLQEEDKEEVQVEDSRSREFEVSAKKKLQEEETSREIAEKQEEHEAQEDTNASKQENISLQEEHPRDSEISDEVMESDLPADLLLTEKKTVEEEKQIVDVKEEKKSVEVQDEKLGELSATRELGESDSSEVKKDQEDASEVGVGPDFQVEKVEEPQSELIQPHHSPNQLEETLFEVSKAQEDSKEDTRDALIKNENVQVEDQPNNYEGPVEDKETSEQAQKSSNDLTHVEEGIGTNDGHDLVVAQNEETNLLEEKKEVVYVKTELENAIKNGVSIEEECFNCMKNTDDATEKTKPEIQEIENLSSVRDIQNISKCEKQEIEEPQEETLKIAHELQKKDGESENSTDFFSEVKDSEPTMKELVRKSLSGENFRTEPTEKVQNPNGAGEEKEELKLEVSTSREFEVSVKEKLPEEETSREIAEKQEEHKAQEDGNASTEEVVCLQAEHLRDLEISDQVVPADLPHTEKKTEIDETIEQEEQIIDAKDEKKIAEVQDEKLEGVYVTKDTEETFSSEVKKDQENASKLGVGHGLTSLQVEKEEEPHSVKERLQDEEAREVAEKQKEDANASTVEVISPQEKQPRDFEISQKVGDNSVQVLESEVPANQVLNIKEVTKIEEIQDENIEGVSPTKDTEETFSSEVKKEQEDVSKLGVSHDLTSPKVEKEEEPHSVLVNDEEKQTTDLAGVTKNAEKESKEEHVEPQAIADDTKAKNDKDFIIKEVDADKSITKEALEEQIEVPSLVVPGEQDLSVKQQSELIQLQQSPNQVEETSFEVSDALIKSENISNTTEKNKASEKINHDASKETEETKPDIREIENLSSVTDKSMIAPEELQQKNGESENTKDTFSKVKDSEPTTKEPARKSLSDLIPTVKGTADKTEEAERKTEEEAEDEEEHKDDKTSPDSLVMVEAKDTVHIIKTHHKKSHGILSGVGSKVKHSISKVKKALTGKSSHTTRPSSPK